MVRMLRSNDGRRRAVLNDTILQIVIMLAIALVVFLVARSIFGRLG